ncbi:glycosyl transferase gt-a type structural fold [Fusarium beomiforme]|uniref:Glycosyl transferase gt-a type structural fold n=1 Tax=Fusarium beomiforme TaxID=44412 RepID=A0A9P5DYK3_9HYPO|nr:glycosyl transferase gt-a type structural fold [Fusarium beomiforme]
MASNQLRIGVFMPSSVQLLDLATVDVLATMSKEYLGLLPLPAHVSEIAPSTGISYITSPKLFPTVNLTADLSVRASHTYEDDDVSPGKLDIIVVPGTNPADKFEKAAMKWLRDHFNTDGVDVLCVCTGVYLCGATGILDGRRVSGPRGLQDELIQRYPNACFVGEEYRWIQDGNLWSSGGITNGNDLMVAYAQARNKFWPNSISKLGAMLVDVGDRPQMYSQGQRKFLMVFVWQVVKAWLFSMINFRKDC